MITDSSRTQRISPAGMARPGFASLRRLHLAATIDELVDELRRQIVKTVQ